MVSTVSRNRNLGLRHYERRGRSSARTVRRALLTRQILLTRLLPGEPALDHRPLAAEYETSSNERCDSNPARRPLARGHFTDATRIPCACHPHPTRAGGFTCTNTDRIHPGRDYDPPMFARCLLVCRGIIRQ